MSLRSRAAAAAGGSLAEVGDLIGDLMGLVHRRSAGGTLALMNEAGLTMPQMVALYILEFRGPQTVSAIASFLKLSPAATSHLVDRLVTAGFVERTEDQQDRRQKRVDITAAGRTLAARVHQERAREFESALALVSSELQRQFASVLGRVVEALRQAPERGGKPDKLTRQWTGDDAPARPNARSPKSQSHPHMKTKREVGR